MKLNRFLSFFVLCHLFLSPFFSGCAKGEGEIISHNPDLPDSVTVKIIDVPEGAVFNLEISTDYSKHKDNIGDTVFVYNNNEKYSVIEDFNKIFPLETEERTISVDLNCTKVDTVSENSPKTIRLIVQFNGEGNFDIGNHDKVHSFEYGTSLQLRSTFSRYNGIAKSSCSFTYLSGSNFRK